MKKFLACLVLGLLLCSGIRAPEAKSFSKGICWSGATIESVQNIPFTELHAPASNPLLVHSSFAPSMHPFELPENKVVLGKTATSFLTSFTDFFSINSSAAPPIRPPINFSI